MAHSGSHPDGGWQNREEWYCTESLLDLVLSKITSPDDLVKWSDDKQYIVDFQEMNIAAALLGRRNGLLRSAAFEENIAVSPLLKKYFEESRRPTVTENWQKSTLLDLAIRFGRSQFAAALALAGCRASRPPPILINYVFGGDAPERCADTYSLLDAAAVVAEIHGVDKKDVLFGPLGFDRGLFDTDDDSSDSSDSSDDDTFRVYLDDGSYGRCRGMYSLLDVAILAGFEDIAVRLDDAEAMSGCSFKLKEFLLAANGAETPLSVMPFFEYPASINVWAVSAAIAAGLNLRRIRHTSPPLSLHDALILDGQVELVARDKQCDEVQIKWTPLLSRWLVMDRNQIGGARLCEEGVEALIAAGIDDVESERVLLTGGSYELLLDAAVLLGQPRLAARLAIEGFHSKTGGVWCEEKCSSRKPFMLAAAVSSIICDRKRQSTTALIEQCLRQISSREGNEISRGFQSTGLPLPAALKINEYLSPNISLNLIDFVTYLCKLHSGICERSALAQLGQCTTIPDVACVIDEIWEDKEETHFHADGHDEDDEIGDDDSSGDDSEGDQRHAPDDGDNDDDHDGDDGDVGEESNGKHENGEDDFAERLHMLDAGSEDDNLECEPAVSISPEEADQLNEVMWVSRVEHQIALDKVCQQHSAVVVILSFNRHPREFTDVLLSSELAKIATANRTQIQPKWANGAKVFVSGVTIDALGEMALSLCRRHVIVLEEDEYQVHVALRALPSRIRPRLKKGCGRTLLPIKLTPSAALPSGDCMTDGSLLEPKSACSRNTFLYIPEPKLINDQSQFTLSATDMNQYLTNEKDGCSVPANPRVWGRNRRSVAKE